MGIACCVFAGKHLPILGRMSPNFVKFREVRSRRGYTEFGGVVGERYGRAAHVVPRAGLVVDGREVSVWLVVVTRFVTKPRCHVVVMNGNVETAVSPAGGSPGTSGYG